MVLGRRLLSEYSARYSIFVELLIFITNERAPPTRVKKTITRQLFLNPCKILQMGRLSGFLQKHLEIYAQFNRPMHRRGHPPSPLTG
jgi:hypothetical protein